MCLGRKLPDRSLARYKAKGKKLGYIRVWKTVREKTYGVPRFVPEFSERRNNRLYPAGFSHARENASSEQELIHAFRDRKSAENWNEGFSTIIEAIVHPDWVKAVGSQYENGDKNRLERTLTTSAIVMPKYPKKRVTVAEFKAAIKGKKIQKYSWEKI